MVGTSGNEELRLKTDFAVCAYEKFIPVGCPKSTIVKRRDLPINITETNISHIFLQ